MELKGRLGGGGGGLNGVEGEVGWRWRGVGVIGEIPNRFERRVEGDG